MKRLPIRTIVLATAGLGATVVLVAGALRWDELALWFQGWQIAWMPQEVLPAEGRHMILNSKGQVLVERSSSDRGHRAGCWSLATDEVADLGTLPVDGDPNTLGLAINDLGHIAGTVYRQGNHLARGFLWTEESGMRELPGLGGSQIAPTCLDVKDRIAGWALPGPRPGLPRRPFLWTGEAGTRDLGTLDAKSTEDCCFAILGDGRVLGTSAGHMFLWSPDSGQRDLGLPQGAGSVYPVAANIRGEVVCSAVTNSRSVPYLWTESGGFSALPLPAGFDATRPLGIAADGTVLFDAGYLLKRGKLEHLPVPRGWSLARYLGINARGWLVGIAERGRPEPFARRGFILKPVR